MWFFKKGWKSYQKANDANMQKVVNLLTSQIKKTDQLNEHIKNLAMKITIFEQRFGNIEVDLNKMRKKTKNEKPRAGRG
jgi:hypothetical protein